MFFQGLVYIILFISASWILWKYIIKPILEANGIQVEEDEDTTIRTSHTKKRDQMKKDFYEKSESADAAEEGVMISKGINELDERIEAADREMKEND